MMCAISGTLPEEPVASRKTGHVFEKRLIEQWIEQNGTDPVTGDTLALDELLPLQTSRNVRPRPPTLTSIPSLLSVFQNEWDALALETCTLRQRLLSTRQELSSALYQHDAAVRVIARLSAERDQARDALAKLSVGSGSRDDGMQIDGEGISPALTATITETRERLSKTRRKRAPPPNWADEEVLQNLSESWKVEPPLPQINSVHVNGDQTLALLAGPQGGVVYSLDSHTEERRISQEDDIIERAIWVADRIALGTTSGSVKIIEEDGKEAMSFKAHAGRVEAMVVHPSGELLVSVGSDNSFVVYDLQQGKIAIRKRVDADLRDAAIHPDGALLAIGDSAGHIRVFDLIECTEQAVFDGTGAISRLEFSENGIWLAAASTGESSISIWDLRKMSLLHSITLSGEIRDIRWDYTGQHLAVAGSEGVSVQHYSKAKKSWSEPFRVGSPCRLLAWGAQARSLVALADSQALIGFGEQ